MITRILYPEEKNQYNTVIRHPIQTWEWGEFQRALGHNVYRLGVFDQDKLINGYTLSFHRLPHTKFSIGTILRGPGIDQDMITNVTKIAQDEQAIFVKFEPDVFKKDAPVYSYNHLVISPKSAFYPHSHIIDLTKSEEELLASLHSKTRYNIRLANRHGVKVEEATTNAGFETYLKLIFNTTQRQGFYLHTPDYHRLQWQILQSTATPHIFLASYQGQVLAAFMTFVCQDRLFYPYGGTLDAHKEVMAPSLLMWEIIKFGKSLGLKSFDMWGSLGPDAREGDNGFGFHRFKQGYGGELREFVGSYDLVLNFPLYKLYNFINLVRWSLLRLKAKFVR